MKLLYIFLLSFVVGSRRLSGYYNKICSICIINLPPVNSQGVILQYFSPVSLTYGFFIGFDEILKESLCSISFQSVSTFSSPALGIGFDYHFGKFLKFGYQCLHFIPCRFGKGNVLS
jgi:hypothetical protein